MKTILNKEQEELFIKEYPTKTNRELAKILNIDYSHILDLSRSQPFRNLRKTEECYKRCRACTEEHRRKNSEAHRGYVMPLEQRMKISKSTLGKIVTEETRKKLSLSKIGDKNPMKRPEVSIKVSKALTGVKFSDERKLSLKYNIENNPNYGMTGKHHTKESMEKRNKTMTERNSFYRPIGDLNVSKRPEIRKIIKETRANIVLPIKDTSIELKIQNFLTQLHIEYIAHKYMNILHGYQCDIFIPVQEGIVQKTIIECDGDAFHFNPNKYNKDSKIFKNGMTAEERWKLDEARTKELIEQGFRVIRLWENEIKKMNAEDLKLKIDKVKI